MSRTFCYWSAVEGEDAAIMSSAIRSARRVGVTEDFHVWSPDPVPGATHHLCGPLERWGGIFKFVFLCRAVQDLDYEAYVWIDADSWFVRHPGDVLKVMQGAPMHASLETNFAEAKHAAAPLWGSRAEVMLELMRSGGVRSNALFTVDGGLFVVRRAAVDTVYELAREFWIFCRDRGQRLEHEPLLSFVMHLLCGNPYAHTLERTADLWACDRHGCFRDGPPIGQPWKFQDCFGYEPQMVNPAILHLPRSKPAMMAWG